MDLEKKHTKIIVKNRLVNDCGNGGMKWIVFCPYFPLQSNRPMGMHLLWSRSRKIWNYFPNILFEIFEAFSNDRRIFHISISSHWWWSMSHQSLSLQFHHIHLKWRLKKKQRSLRKKNHRWNRKDILREMNILPNDLNSNWIIFRNISDLV